MAANKNHRVTTTLSEDEFQTLKYWADKEGISINEVLKEGLSLFIAFKNDDYTKLFDHIVPERFNQLIDLSLALSSDIHSLISITVNGFDSLINLTRGDNYLLEDEDGEI